MFKVIGFIVGLAIIMLIIQPMLYENGSIQAWLTQSRAKITATDKDKPHQVENLLDQQANELLPQDQTATEMAAETADLPNHQALDLNLSQQEKSDSSPPVIKDAEPVIVATDTSANNLIPEAEIPQDEAILPAKSNEALLQSEIQQVVWPAFNSKASATNFAQHITLQTGVELMVAETSQGQYQLILDAQDKQSLQANVQHIEQKMGLILMKSL